MEQAVRTALVRSSPFACDCFASSSFNWWCSGVKLLVCCSMADEISEGSSVEDMDTPRDDEAIDACSKAVLKTLNPDGKEEIHLDEVLQRIKTVKHHEEKKKAERDKHVEKVVRKLIKNKAGEGLTESDMKKLNERFMDGHLPRLKNEKRQREDEDKDSDEETEQKGPEGIQKKILRHVIKSFSVVWRFAEKSVSSTGRVWMWRLLPTGQISTLLSFLLFSYVIRASFLSWFVPLAVLFLAICVMVISTIRIVRGMKRFAEFIAWAEFLDAITAMEEKSIDTGKAEENYLLNHISPYIHFLLATACCVMGYGISDKSWVLNAELGVLALLMYFVVVYVFKFHTYPDTRQVFACQILASILRGVTIFSSHGFGYIGSVDLPYFNAVVNFSLPAVLKIVMAYKIMSMFWRFPRHGKIGAHLVKYVLPLVVAVAWWDAADLFIANSSIFSIVRASVEYLSLLFMMPAFVLLLGYTILKFLFSIELTKLSITIAAVVVATLYFTVWRKKSDAIQKFKKLIESTSLKYTIYICGFLTLGYIMLSYRPSGIKVLKSGLTFDEYNKACSIRQQAPNGNQISKFDICNEFKGYGVTWEGKVWGVHVVSVENKVEDLLNLFPHSLATWLSCLYGSKYPDEKKCSNINDLSTVDKTLCQVAPYAKRPCHIHKYNLYTFNVGVSMRGSDVPTISLGVSHDFYDVVVQLERGMPLRFSGIITGEETLTARILQVETDDQVKSIERVRKRIEKTFDNMLDEAVDSLCNFVFYPVVTITESEE